MQRTHENKRSRRLRKPPKLLSVQEVILQVMEGRKKVEKSEGVEIKIVKERRKKVN